MFLILGVRSVIQFPGSISSTWGKWDILEEASEALSCELPKIIIFHKQSPTMHLRRKEQPFTYILHPPNSGTEAVPLSVSDQNLEIYCCVLTPQTGGICL